MKKINIKYFWLFLIIVSLSACKGPKLYTEASQYYSNAVKLEMAERSSNSTDKNTPELEKLYAAEGTPSGAWESYFDKAYEKINMALKSKASLKKNNLLGNTYAIKALVEWQKEKYTEADETALNAANVLENSDHSGYESTRDLTIMKAMPGLIAIDIVYDTSLNFIQHNDDRRQVFRQFSGEESSNFFKNELQAHYKKYIAGESTGPYSIQKALNYIQNAKQHAGEYKKLKQYLVLCQLAAHKTWKTTLISSENSAKLAHLVPGRGPVDVWFKAVWADYKRSRTEHLKMLEDMLPAGNQDNIYRYFEEIL